MWGCVGDVQEKRARTCGFYRSDGFVGQGVRHVPGGLRAKESLVPHHPSPRVEFEVGSGPSEQGEGMVESAIDRPMRTFQTDVPLAYAPGFITQLTQIFGERGNVFSQVTSIGWQRHGRGAGLAAESRAVRPESREERGPGTDCSAPPSRNG